MYVPWWRICLVCVCQYQWDAADLNCDTQLVDVQGLLVQQRPMYMLQIAIVHNYTNSYSTIYLSIVMNFHAMYCEELNFFSTGNCQYILASVPLQISDSTILLEF